jgi:hypothetical protein
MTNADQTDSLSLQELLAAVESRGYTPTVRQAKRYRAEGLLRCLGQEHPAGTRLIESLRAVRDRSARARDADWEN